MKEVSNLIVVLRLACEKFKTGDLDDDEYLTIVAKTAGCVKDVAPTAWSISSRKLVFAFWLEWLDRFSLEDVLDEAAESAFCYLLDTLASHAVTKHIFEKGVVAPWHSNFAKSAERLLELKQGCKAEIDEKRRQCVIRWLSCATVARAAVGPALGLVTLRQSCAAVRNQGNTIVGDLVELVHTACLAIGKEIPVDSASGLVHLTSDFLHTLTALPDKPLQVPALCDFNNIIEQTRAAGVMGRAKVVMDEAHGGCKVTIEGADFLIVTIGDFSRHNFKLQLATETGDSVLAKVTRQILSESKLREIVVPGSSVVANLFDHNVGTEVTLSVEGEITSTLIEHMRATTCSLPV